MFLSHAPERTGPPIMLLHLLRWLRANGTVDTHVVFLRRDELEPDFAEVTSISVLDEFDLPVISRLTEFVLAHVGLAGLADRLRAATLRHRVRQARNPDLVYVNTAASVRALRYLPGPPAPVLTHVHELEVGLEYHLPAEDRLLIEQSTSHYIAASDAVRTTLEDGFGIDADQVSVVHEFVDTDDDGSPDQTVGLRRLLGIGATAPVVGSIGQPSWRKAPDLFVLLARLVSERLEGDPPHFVWVGGDPDAPELAAARYDADRAGLGDRLHFIPHDPRPTRWLPLFDVFALPSREDAYPLVCLEAAAAGRPLVCFDRGGIPEFVEPSGAGFVVAYPDLDAFADRIVRLLRDRPLAQELGRRAALTVRRDHGIAPSSSRILDIIEQVL